MKRSTMVTSQPWGFGDQTQEEVAPFTNQAVVVETELAAEELLNALQQIENELGRRRTDEQQEREQRGVRYLSRKIDIDIIFYGDHVIQSERLTTPHPLMAEREFVLEPLVEIEPEWRHPLLRVSCRELLNRLNDKV